MIIARITGPNCGRQFHGSVEIEGSPADDDYRWQGWFPVDSFNFDPAGADGANDKSNAATTATRTAPRTGQNGGISPPAAGQERNFSEMQLTKEIDRATAELMRLALKERSKGKGADKPQEMHADIHVLSSVVFGKEKVERSIFANLMVHLEGVHVTHWNISASGDARPTESVKLRYDKSAMVYVWTDGREFMDYPERGWDQTKHEPWTPPNLEQVFKKYIPKF